MLRALDTFAGRVIALSAFLGTLGLLTEVVVILIDVTGRFFGAPLHGAQDVTQMAMVVLVFGGMALCDRQGGHIAVDLFEHSFPRWLNRLGDVVASLLGAAIFVAIAWTTLESAALSRMLNSATNIIGLQKAWFQYYVFASCVVTSFGMALKALVLMSGGTIQKGLQG